MHHAVHMIGPSLSVCADTNAPFVALGPMSTTALSMRGPRGIKDGLPLVVSRFASRGQTLCIPTLADNGSAVVAALEAGCTVIGADEDQSVIDVIVREASEPADDSFVDPESE